MAYFESQTPRWPQHGRQQSWDPSQPNPRSGAQRQWSTFARPMLTHTAGLMSPTSQREESPPFGSQFEGASYEPPFVRRPSNAILVSLLALRRPHPFSTLQPNPLTLFQKLTEREKIWRKVVVHLVFPEDEIRCP